MSQTEIIEEILAQQMSDNVSQNQDVIAITRLSRPSSNDLYSGIASAISSQTTQPLSYLESTDQGLQDQIDNINNQQGGGQTPTPTPGGLTFSISGPVTVGYWVFQSSDNTVSLSDSSTAASGPILGVVTDVAGGIATVLDIGLYTYAATDTHPFLPLIPDQKYYAHTVAGSITLSPNPPSGGFVQEIGYAKTSLEFVVSVQEPILV